MGLRSRPNRERSPCNYQARHSSSSEASQYTGRASMKYLTQFSSKQRAWRHREISTQLEIRQYRLHQTH